MKELAGTIYRITCLTTGKCYVGQTTHSLEKRFARHCWESTQNRGAMAVTRAIAKYGKDTFVIETLEANIPYACLDGREVWWIERLGTLSPGGYNLQYHKGGHHVVAPEVRERLRVASTGRKASSETRERLRVAHLGQKWTIEQTAAASARLKGQRASAAAYEAARQMWSKTWLLRSPE